MPGKRRLDLLLVDRKLAVSRSKAASMIMAAEVYVDGRIVDKPGTSVTESAAIRLKAKPRYVSRGGLKLEAALSGFGIDPSGKHCADVGASTGGFTDCLLRHGAARVHAIDVGFGILDYSLRINERVHLLERTNARHLNSLEELVDIVVIDVSFISLRLILPSVKQWLKPDGDVVALVKPQFEAGKSDVGKRGIVRDPAVHRRVLQEIVQFAHVKGYVVLDLLKSPIKGQKGNIEFLLWLRMGLASAEDNRIIDRINALFESSD